LGAALLGTGVVVSTLTAEVDYKQRERNVRLNQTQRQKPD